MEFFDFGNTEAFHLFRWITTERQADLDVLIERAFGQAETHPMFEHGMTPCICARDELADLLSEEYLPEQFEKDGLFQDFGCAPQDGTEGLTSLTEQLLVLAANSISYSAVAEALLRYCDKWAPDLERPEIL